MTLRGVSWEINAVVIVVLLVAIVICLTVSKHLPVKEAMAFFQRILDWVTSRRNKPENDDDVSPSA